MKKSRFTDSQIMDGLKGVESGVGVQEICQEMRISSATFYKWRAKCYGMDTSMMVRMKELEIENARLKKIYAEERRTVEVLSEALKKSLTPARKREAVEYPVGEDGISVHTVSISHIRMTLQEEIRSLGGDSKLFCNSYCQGDVFFSCERSTNFLGLA